ncbi:MAG TPA: 2-oxo acid dehydrogenase subunit E2 [Steroidobacter sp.]|nr:2-oxo acid dehydrogenase subunit E2 [Steroidobacter sp.]
MGRYIEIRAPEHSEGTRSQVQRWLKSIGDEVDADEPLIEVETDKVTIEIPSPARGVLRQIAKQEQEEIAPGDVLGAIEAAAVNVQAAPRQDVVESSAEQSAVAEQAGIRTAAFSARAAAMSPRISPAVRRLIQQYRLDPSDVEGTGEGGRITVDDVLAHVAQAHEGAPNRAVRAPAPVEHPTTVARRVPHSLLRRRIAERMVESLLQTAPHVTTVFEADMSAVMLHRDRHRDEFARRGANLTLTAYFLVACVDAIREVPEVNSRWTEDALEMFDNIDIGVGTAVEGRGLVVPVVHNVHTLDLFGVAQCLGDLVTRTREDKLTTADVQGGTFTISNHGVSGSLVATPIVINQPQSAILGVGKLEKRPVVISENGDDHIVVQPRCYVTLTIDHRVMDGHRANRFLEALVRRLESWGD